MESRLNRRFEAVQCRHVLALLLPSAAAGVLGCDSSTGPNPPEVAAIAVSPSADTLLVRDTLRFSAEATDPDGNVVAGAEFAWSSEDTLVVVVDASGLATGVGAGQAAVVATSSGMTGRAEITVVPRISLDGAWEGSVSRDTVQVFAFTFELNETGGSISGSVEAVHAESGPGSGDVTGSLSGQGVTLDFNLAGATMSGRFSYSGDWDGEDVIEGELAKAGFNERLPLVLRRRIE